MQNLNTNARIKLTILSPVHVGAGSDKWLKYGIDWLDIDDYVYILNQESVFEELGSSQDKYLDFIGKGNFFDAGKVIHEYIDVTDKQFHHNAYFYDGGALKDDIQPLIRTGLGETYLPATSIKGAISSIIFRYLFNTKGLAKAAYNKHTQTDLMGSFKSSIMRFVRPSDVVVAETEYNNAILFNLYSDKRDSSKWTSEYKTEKNGKNFKISIEHFKTNATGTMRLSIATGLADFIIKNKPVELPLNYSLVIKENPIDFLFSLINKHTDEHLRREIAFFEKYNQADDIEMVIKQLKALQQKIAIYVDNKTCILRMSSGIGFHGITGDWRFEDHTSTIAKPDELNKTWSQTQRATVPARYKSRKLIDAADLAAMGFVELKQVL